MRAQLIAMVVVVVVACAGHDPGLPLRAPGRKDDAASKLIQLSSDLSVSSAQLDKSASDAISAISDPAKLKNIVAATRLWVFAQHGDGVCTPCDRLELVQSRAMARLVAIGSDDAARELVSFLERDDLRWDSSAGLTLGMFITQMGRRALPHLERSPSGQAQRIIQCINTGNPCK